MAAPTNSNGSMQDEAAFKRFDAYPWGSDRKFLQALDAMIGPSADDISLLNSERFLSLALLARIYYYQGSQGVVIKQVEYERWSSFSGYADRPDAALLTKINYIRRRMQMAGHRNRSSSGDRGKNGRDDSDTPVPSWQIRAPLADLGRKANEMGGSEEILCAGGASEGQGPTRDVQEAPYPKYFAAIIEAVKTGKQIPGIREIPDTIVRQEGVLPKGKMQSRIKPWERNAVPAANSAPILADDSTSSKWLDWQFPPVEENIELAVLDAQHTAV